MALTPEGSRRFGRPGGVIRRHTGEVLLNHVAGLEVLVREASMRRDVRLSERSVVQRFLADVTDDRRVRFRRVRRDDRDALGLPDRILAIP